MPGTSFEAMTGRLGVGAVALLGAFLLVDGLNHQIFPLLIENFGKSVTWGLIGILPTAVVTYIVGVLCFGLAEVLFAGVPSLGGPTPEAIVAVSATDSMLLQAAYTEQVRAHELLKGKLGVLRRARRRLPERVLECWRHEYCVSLHISRADARRRINHLFATRCRPSRTNRRRRARMAAWWLSHEPPPVAALRHVARQRRLPVLHDIERRRRTHRHREEETAPSAVTPHSGITLGTLNSRFAAPGRNSPFASVSIVITEPSAVR